MARARGRKWGLVLASVVAVVLLLLGLVACGGDGSTTGSRTAGGDTVAPSERSAASEEFVTPGGDNSVQRFGEEATGAERNAISTRMKAYMWARSVGRWAEQCSLMSRAAKKPFQDFVMPGQPGSVGRGCLGALTRLGGSTPESSRIDTLAGPVDSVRVEGNRAFALYHGTDGVDYVMPLSREGAKWMIDSLAPLELP